MKKYLIRKRMKRALAGILTVIMLLAGIDLSQFVFAQEASGYDTLYLIDNTAEKWVKNDNAKIKAIDNSNGHTEYWMTQRDETTWSVRIPKSAYNITFNRYSEDETTQWNSWSAGGRDENNTYYVDGSEYGHWGIADGSEEYFHAGDIIYLDVSEFTQWENDDAVMYVNFTDASKEENNQEDVWISSADKKMYNPQKVENKIKTGIYQYVVTKEEEGAEKLRFWRGNDTTLWNFSIALSYEDYLEGLDCVKVTGWDDTGSIEKMIPDLNFDEDYLIVQSAISELAIGYKDNDTRYSVTDHLGLVTELYGATIEWSSSNAEVITNEGIVNRPENESTEVILTATVKSNSYFETKQFEVYVIKNKYADYNTDDIEEIEDMDSLEMLYLYNGGNVDDLEVYVNDEGYIKYIMGSFSDLIVESPEEAILSLYTVKSLMGSKSPKEELQWVSTNKDNYGAAFRFEQVYQGIPIYGMSIVVSTNQLGYTSSLQSSFVGDINISTTPSLSESEARQKIIEYGYQESEVEKLYIYMDNSTPKLAWNVYAKDLDGLQYNILIDAANGEVLFENLNSLNEVRAGRGITKGTGTSELGTQEEFSVVYYLEETEPFEIARFELRDAVRNIEVYDFASSEDKRLDPDKRIVKTNNIWEQDEVSAMANVAKAYDFYFDHFGRRGFDDENSVIPVILHDAGIVDNSKYTSANDALNFGSSGEDYIYSGAAALDTVGHEFTHGVINHVSSLGLCYYNAPGAIKEGYADIFGYFIEGDDDDEWLHREDNTRNARALRNMSNPAEFRQPSVIGGQYYYDFTAGNYDNGGVHKNNTIVSHACYLMWKNGIRNKTRLAELWYHSLFKGYDGNSEFDSVRINVLAAAKDMRMSAEELQIIKAAFDEVGIEGSGKFSIIGTNVLTGKVVEADTDMIVGNNLPLGDVSISIVRTGLHMFEPAYFLSSRHTTTSEDGTFYISDIVPGTYKLIISKEGYCTTTQLIEFTTTKLNNSCGTIELLPLAYSGTGQAQGKIVDSSTGNGVEGLSLKIRKGLNTKTGEIVAEVQSQSEGLYETPELEAGHYCVEIVDNKEKYDTTYFNIKVLGGCVIPDQDAMVSASTAVESEQLRIVLEWSDYPKDLDAYLSGPTSSGDTFLVFFGEKKYSEGNTLIAELDSDRTGGYGPETITIYNTIEGIYTFLVHNHSTSPDISVSEASVKVYMGDTNEPQYVFYIPTSEMGRRWTVFTYDSRTKEITPVNIVQ